MNSTMSKEELEQILDQAVQDVTECTAGVRLHQGKQSPGEDLCTVQITFDRGLRNRLAPKIWRNSAKNILMYSVAG